MQTGTVGARDGGEPETGAGLQATRHWAHYLTPLADWRTAAAEEFKNMRLMR